MKIKKIPRVPHVYIISEDGKVITDIELLIEVKKSLEEGEKEDED